MGPFYHHLECKKRYQPDATDEAQGIDCPYCHPDIYIEEEARQGCPQAKMKTGITEQPQGIVDRYDATVAQAATYRHEYPGDTILKFAIEEFYQRKIVCAFPRNRFDRNIHTETYICNAVEDSQVVAVADNAMHELSILGLHGTSLLAPGAAPVVDAAPGTIQH